MICEICGSEVRHLRTVVVDRATLDVCERCARFGTPVETKAAPAGEKKAPRRATGSRRTSVGRIQTDYDVVDGYGALIRAAREKRGLTQEDLGKKVSEKSSTIHRLESESLAPSIALARKLERFLKVKLLEQAGLEEELTDSLHSSDDNTTLGEVIKVKRKE
jgi:putative transcription factor